MPRTAGLGANPKTAPGAVLEKEFSAALSGAILTSDEFYRQGHGLPWRGPGGAFSLAGCGAEPHGLPARIGYPRLSFGGWSDLSERDFHPHYVAPFTGRTAPVCEKYHYPFTIKAIYPALKRKPPLFQTDSFQPEILSV